MSLITRSVKKHIQARQRPALKHRERSHVIAAKRSTQPRSWNRRSRTWASPDNLVAEIEGRLRSQQKLLSKICGMMFPPLFGCRTNTELCRVRGWDKNLPARLLGALPKRSWIKRLRHLGLEVLVPLWHHAASKSAATRSRWQWTWVGDDSVFKKVASSWAWWAPGGVGRNTGYSPVLMASCWWW